MGKIRYETKDEARQRHKQNIVFNALQAARVESVGYYTEKGQNVVISNNDRQQHSRLFMDTAFTEAMAILRLETEDIDCTVD